MKCYKLIIVIILLVLIGQIAIKNSPIGVQNVHFRQEFSGKKYDTQNYKFYLTFFPTNTEYTLDKNTVLSIMGLPIEFYCHIDRKNDLIQSVCLEKLKVTYADSLINEKVVVEKNSFLNFDDSNKIIFQIDNFINIYKPFKCEVTLVIRYKDNTQEAQSFELNFTTSYKGERSYRIIDALLSV